MADVFIHNTAIVFITLNLKRGILDAAHTRQASQASVSASSCGGDAIDLWNAPSNLQQSIDRTTEQLLKVQGSQKFGYWNQTVTLATDFEALEGCGVHSGTSHPH